MDTINRLKRVLTMTEIDGVKMLINEIGDEEERIISFKEAVKEYGITRSMVNLSIRFLEVVGIIESRSLGMKGTYIKILDKEMFDNLSELF